MADKWLWVSWLLGAWLLLNWWRFRLIRVFVFLVFVPLSFQDNLTALLALVVHAGTCDIMESELTDLNHLLACRALFGLWSGCCIHL